MSVPASKPRRTLPLRLSSTVTFSTGSMPAAVSITTDSWFFRDKTNMPPPPFDRAGVPARSDRLPETRQRRLGRLRQRSFVHPVSIDSGPRRGPAPGLPPQGGMGFPDAQDD